MSSQNKSERRFRQARRWVVKIGSALLTADGRGLDKDAIGRWAGQIAALVESGKQVVLVSSGSVAEGLVRLGWAKRPHAIHDLQAAAAVGQMGLVQTWESAFSKHGRQTAQILLTHADLAARERYLNAASALRTLLSLGVVPVINENDTVAVDEIRLGDNDTLAAQVANLIDADLLVLLTDQDGLFDADPRQNPEASLIDAAQVDDSSLDRVAGGGGALGRGGMVTKLRAARQAARSGTHTVIANGREADVLARLVADEALGTWLRPVRPRQEARKHWLSTLKPAGSLILDAGAVQVLRQSGRSLLPVGVTSVDGEFERGALVICRSPDGEPIARGLVNYSAADSRAIAGHASKEIEALLGYVDELELIHRDNMIVD